jgi:hypothetical protein
LQTRLTSVDRGRCGWSPGGDGRSGPLLGIDVTAHVAAHGPSFEPADEAPSSGRISGLSPGDGTDADWTSAASGQRGREPDDPATARGVDERRHPVGRGVQQPRPVPGQRSKTARRRPGSPVHGHRGTARADKEHRRSVSSHPCRDVGDQAAARADGKLAEAGRLTFGAGILANTRPSG